MSSASVIQRMFAQQAKERTARIKAAQKQKKDDGGGLLEDIGGAIEHGIGKLGVGNLAAMPVHMAGGLVDLGLGAAHGLAGGVQMALGHKRSKENDLSMLTRAGKGFLYGLENTASIGSAPIAAGLGAVTGQNFSNKDVWGGLNKALARGKEPTYHPQPFWNNPEGILPGIAVDMMNASLVGKGVSKLAATGDVGKLAAARVATEESLTSGGAQAAKAAAKAAERAKPVVERLGEEGVQRMEPDIAKRASVLDKAHLLEHPIREPFNRIVRPLVKSATGRLSGAAGREGLAADLFKTALEKARTKVAKGTASAADVQNVWEAGQRVQEAAARGAEAAPEDLAVLQGAEATPEAPAATQGVPEGAPAPQPTTPAGFDALGALREVQGTGGADELAAAARAAEAAQEGLGPSPANQALLQQHPGEPTVTLYRGEPPGHEGAARGDMWTLRPGEATGHARGGTVYEVQVPESVAAKAVGTGDTLRANGGDVVTPGTHILPPEWADASQPMPQAPPEVPAPGVRTPNEDLAATYREANPELNLPKEAPIHVGDYPTNAMADLADQYVNRPDMTGTPEMDTAYQAFKDETLAQSDHATGGGPETWVAQADGTMLTPNGLRLTFTDGETYPGTAAEAAEAMRADLANGHLNVRSTVAAGDGPNAYTAETLTSDPTTPISVPVHTAQGVVQQPLLLNDVFRIVHDIYGHAAANDFGGAGELTAWRLHDALYSEAAKPALANESIGQTAALEKNGTFPPQRVPQLDQATLDRVRVPDPDLEPGGLPEDAPVPEHATEELHQPHEPFMDVPEYRRQAHIYDKPLPQWASDVVQRMPEPLVKALSQIDRVIMWHDSHVLVRQLARVAEADRNETFHSQPVQIMAKDIGQKIVGETLDTGVKITPEIADRMVGATVMARLTGSRLVDVFPFIGESPLLTDVLNRVAHNGDVIPAEMIERLGLEEPLGQATELMRQAAHERNALMASGRLGLKGLSPEDTGFLLSKSEQKMVNKLMLVTKRIVTLDQVARGEVQRAVTGTTELLNRIARLEDEKLLHEEAAAAARDSVNAQFEFPHPTENPKVQRSLLDFSERLLKDGGGTLDLMTGRILEPRFATGVTRGRASLMEVPVNEFVADPVRYLNEALGDDPIFNLPWVKLGTWVTDGVVHIDPSVTEWPTDIKRWNSSMTQLDRGRAWLIGTAFHQEAAFAAAEEGGKFVDVNTAYGPGVADLASHFVDTALNPRSQFSRYMHELHKAVDVNQQHNQGYPMRHSGVDADMIQHMQAVYAQAKSRGLLNEDGSIPNKVIEDYFGKRHIEYSKSKVPGKIGGTGALNQIVLDLDLDNPATFKRIVKEMGPAYDQAIRWYHDSHKAIERYRGQEVVLGDGSRIDAADLMHQLVAITSIKSSPLTNLGNAMNALGNWLDWQKGGDAALKSYQKGMDRFLALPAHQRTMENMIDSLLHDVPKSERTAAESVQQVGNARASTSEPLGYTTGAHPDTGAHLKGIYAVLSGHTLDKWTPEDLLNLNVPWGGAAKTLRKGETIAERMARIPEHIQEQARAEADAVAGGAADEAAVAQRAIALHAGGNAWAKILSFWQNLADPVNSRAVTLDSWMARAFGRAAWTTPGDYAAITKQIADLADRWGVEPHAVQAALWVYAKDKINQTVVERVWGAGTSAVRMSDDPGFQYGGANDPLYRMLETNNTRTSPKAGPLVEEAPMARKAGGRIRTEIVRHLNKGFADSERRLNDYLVRAKDWNARRAAGEDVTGAVINYYDGLANSLKDSVGNADMDQFWGKERVAIGAARSQLVDQAMVNPADMMDGLFQEIEGRVVGHTVGATETGRATIRLFKGGDFGTLMHENAHVFRDLLEKEDVPKVEAAMDLPEGTFERRLDDPMWGPVRRAAEEQFVEEMLGYIFSGKHSNPGLLPIMEHVKANMADLWDAYSHTREAEYTINPGLAQLWDTYLNPVEAAPPVETIIAKAAEHDEQFLQGVPEGWSAEQIAAYNKARPGETIAEAIKRQKKMDRDVMRAQMHERAAATRARRIGVLSKNLDQMHAIITEGGSPKVLAERARLETKGAALSDKLAEVYAHPKTRQVPPVWQPMWEAIQGLHKAAADDPVLAQELVGMTDRFDQMMRRAHEMGFDPTHVRDFSPEQVRRLINGPIQIGKPGRLGMEETAATRLRRTTGTARDQSIRALAAARAEVMGESITNAVVDFYDNHVAVPVPEGGTLPKGWKPWDTRRNMLLHGVEELEHTKGQQPAEPVPTKMIPAAVDRALKAQTKNYTHWTLTGLQKITNPWRTFILTMSPRWYIHTTLGTTWLSVQAGARFKDFAKSWEAYRDDKKGLYNTEAQRMTGRHLVGGNSLYHDSAAETNTLVPSGAPGSFMRDMREGTVGRNAVTRATRIGRIKATLSHIHDSIQSFNRGAVYHSVFRSTGDAAMALQEARRALVDYGDLTPFERSAVRAVVPFYSWQKGVLKAIAHVGYDHPIAFGVMDRLAAAHAEWQRDKYGTELPPGYGAVVDIFGTPANLSFADPYASASRLFRPDGIAQSMNPFIDVLVRSQFGATDQGRPDKYRMDAYGRLVPDVSVTKGLLGIGESLPILDTALAATSANTYEPSYGEGLTGGTVGHYLGSPALSDKLMNRIVERTKQTKATLSGKKTKKRRKHKVTTPLDAYLKRLKTSSGLK